MAPLWIRCLALQAFLCWTCGMAQAPGFLSIDCGSKANFTDTAANGNIEWISDEGLMTEGESLFVGGAPAPYATSMRLFTGNHSKYCYTLSNSAVTEGAFFLVRATFWQGSDTLPYTPKNPDGRFRFKLLVDADEMRDIDIGYNATVLFPYEIYTRALRSSIDVCLARTTPDGDPPFISSLELRPLPSSLSAIRILNSTGRAFVSVLHADYISNRAAGTPSVSRYPADSLDRTWFTIPVNSPGLVTKSAINTSTDQDIPPAIVLQTSYNGGVNDSRNITASFTSDVLLVNAEYYFVFHFAEIDPAVNTSGLRMFDILLNGQPTPVNEKPIDVYAEVGGNAAYEFLSPPMSGLTLVEFAFLATPTSLFPPFVAAVELLQARNSTVSTGTFPSDVNAIKDLKTSMNLNSYSGDPCLPNGFGYSWLTCMRDTTSEGDPRIISISLSNYSKGGNIPKTINNLVMLKQILLDDNDLVGSIPDMSALASLETLDLSNNNLSGSIRESLATLKSLKVLNLKNNNLNGEIPPALLERRQASTLDFEFSGNPFCQNSSVVTCTSPPSSPSSSKSKSHSRLIIGVMIPILLVVIIGTIFCCWKKKTHIALKKSFRNILSAQHKKPASQRPTPEPVINRPLPLLSLQEFTFQEIETATNNFSTQLGMGGFGPVYKGTLADGRIVAIKVASNSSHQGSKEFLNEVDLLSRIHHKNLVELLGYCNEGKLVLVYEFMSNGSLFDCLHGPFAKASPLSWRTRLKILVDSAQGFDYLHDGCKPRIIHRDIKSSNILLSDQLDAKISDFGISRNSIVTGSGAFATTALMGSMGYMDPEYLATMRLTEKIDVYSFGVVLFEVVCGKRVVFFNECQEQIHIVEWIKPYIECGSIEDIVDAALHKQYDTSSVWKVIEVALACVQYSSSHLHEQYSSSQRPKMNEVFLELKEAQRIEFESYQGDVFDNPSTPHDYDSLSLTHVQAR